MPGPAMPYTRRVKLAALICLPAIAYAALPPRVVPHVTYSVGEVVTGGAASTSLGGWEVTAGFDPVRCEVYCIYKQKPGPVRLAPPITVVEVYTDAVSKPRIVTFDPAGLGLPSATAKARPIPTQTGLPQGKLSSVDIPDCLEIVRVVQAGAVVPASPYFRSAPRTLRI